jgi:hypothetical protein
VNATTPADRARWQRQSAHTLARVLDAHRHLPVLVWTVTAAGISARVLVVEAMHSALDQFTAWTTALGLNPRRHDTPDLNRTYLHARGEIAGTRITITAIIDRTR